MAAENTNFRAPALVNSLIITIMVLLFLYFAGLVYKIVILLIAHNRFAKHNSKTYSIPFYPLMNRTFNELSVPQYIASEALLADKAGLLLRRRQIEVERKKKLEAEKARKRRHRQRFKRWNLSRGKKTEDNSQSPPGDYKELDEVSSKSSALKLKSTSSTPGPSDSSGSRDRRDEVPTTDDTEPIRRSTSSTYSDLRAESSVTAPPRGRSEYSKFLNGFLEEDTRSSREKRPTEDSVVVDILEESTADTFSSNPSNTGSSKTETTFSTASNKLNNMFKRKKVTSKKKTPDNVLERKKVPIYGLRLPLDATDTDTSTDTLTAIAIQKHIGNTSGEAGRGKKPAAVVPKVYVKNNNLKLFLAPPEGTPSSPSAPTPATAEAQVDTTSLSYLTSEVKNELMEIAMAKEITYVCEEIVRKKNSKMDARHGSNPSEGITSIQRMAVYLSLLKLAYGSDEDAAAVAISKVLPKKISRKTIRKIVREMNELQIPIVCLERLAIVNALHPYYSSIQFRVDLIAERHMMRVAYFVSAVNHDTSSSSKATLTENEKDGSGNYQFLRLRRPDASKSSFDSTPRLKESPSSGVFWPSSDKTPLFDPQSAEDSGVYTHHSTNSLKKPSSLRGASTSNKSSNSFFTQNSKDFSDAMSRIKNFSPSALDAMNEFYMYRQRNAKETVTENTGATGAVPYSSSNDQRKRGGSGQPTASPEVEMKREPLFPSNTLSPKTEPSAKEFNNSIRDCYRDVRVAFIIGADRATLLRANSVHATNTFQHGRTNFVCVFSVEEEINAIRRHMSKGDQQERLRKEMRQRRSQLLLYSEMGEERYPKSTRSSPDPDRSLLSLTERATSGVPFATIKPNRILSFPLATNNNNDGNDDDYDLKSGSITLMGSGKPPPSNRIPSLHSLSQDPRTADSADPTTADFMSISSHETLSMSFETNHLDLLSSTMPNTVKNPKNKLALGGGDNDDEEEDDVKSSSFDEVSGTQPKTMSSSESVLVSVDVSENHSSTTSAPFAPSAPQNGAHSEQYARNKIQSKQNSEEDSKVDLFRVEVDVNLPKEIYLVKDIPHSRRQGKVEATPEQERNELSRSGSLSSFSAVSSNRSNSLSISNNVNNMSGSGHTNVTPVQEYERFNSNTTRVASLTQGVELSEIVLETLASRLEPYCGEGEKVPRERSGSSSDSVLSSTELDGSGKRGVKRGKKGDLPNTMGYQTPALEHRRRRKKLYKIARKFIHHADLPVSLSIFFYLPAPPPIHTLMPAGETDLPLEVVAEEEALREPRIATNDDGRVCISLIYGATGLMIVKSITAQKKSILRKQDAASSLMMSHMGDSFASGATAPPSPRHASRTTSRIVRDPFTSTAPSTPVQKNGSCLLEHTLSPETKQDSTPHRKGKKGEEIVQPAFLDKEQLPLPDLCLVKDTEAFRGGGGSGGEGWNLSNEMDFPLSLTHDTTTKACLNYLMQGSEDAGEDGAAVPVRLLYLRVGDELYELIEVIDKTFSQYREERLLNPGGRKDQDLTAEMRRHADNVDALLTGRDVQDDGAGEEDEDEEDDDELLSSNASIVSILETSLMREVEKAQREEERQQRMGLQKQFRRERRRRAAVSTLGFSNQLYSLSTTPGARRQLVHMCWRCLTSEAKVLFLPCGHFAVCETCADELFSCCVCESGIESTITLR